MDKLLDFFNKFFSKPSYQLGAVLNTDDSRDVHLASFQLPVSVPETYITDISMLPVWNQGSHGSCVAQAIGKAIQYYEYKENKRIADLSPRYLYKRVKDIDGLQSQGTYPRLGAKIAKDYGCATSKTIANSNNLPYSEYLGFNITNDMDLDAKPFKTAGYAFVDLTKEALKQAIFQNGVVTATLAVDKSYNFSKRPTEVIGYHHILIYGFNGDTFFLRNSWGNWDGDGNGQFNWSDYENYIYDVLVFTDLPNEILEQTKKNFEFTKNLSIGDTGNDVIKLQDRLREENCFPITSKSTGYFGPVTSRAISKYQCNKGVPVTGSLDKKTRETLNGKPDPVKDYINLMALAIQKHEGYFKGSRSYRNNSPANFKQKKLSSYMKKLGAIGLDSGGFVIFPSYEVGFKALCTFLRAACAGQLSVYKSSMTILDFFNVYAPPFENDTNLYAVIVAKALGLPVDTQIKNLI